MKRIEQKRGASLDRDCVLEYHGKREFVVEAGMMIEHSRRR